MSEMVKRVADAIREVNNDTIGLSYTELTEAMARAAISAVSSPDNVAAIIEDCRNAAKVWRMDVDSRISSDGIADIYDRIADSLSRVTSTEPQGIQCYAQALEAAGAFIKAEHEYRTHIRRSVPSARELAKAVERGEHYKQAKKKAEKLIEAALSLSSPQYRSEP